MTLILMLDSSATPIRWAGMHKAASYYANGKVIVELGEHRFPLLGGTRHIGGEPAIIGCSPATTGLRSTSGPCSRATETSAPTAAAASIQAS